MEKIKKIIGTAITLLYILLIIQIPFNDLSVFQSGITLTQNDIENFQIHNVDINYSQIDSAVNEKASASASTNTKGKLSFNIFNLFPIKTIDVNVAPDRKVFVGGFPIGLSINSFGAIVVGVGEVRTRLGVSDVSGGKIFTGDIVTKIDDKDIISSSDIFEALDNSDGSEVLVTVNRNGELVNIKLNPVIDIATNKPRLGIWVRDNVSGIGTVTYVRLDGRFGALGHNMNSGETNTMVPCYDGKVYNCNILGVNKGVQGRAGELRGMFTNVHNPIGTIDKNTKYGVFGKIDGVYEDELIYDVGSRFSVKNGKAQIVATVDNERDFYDIEIIKAENQQVPDDKSMIIKVTDKRLLEKTGGIVQGMSGSPIIQNGKVIGAVTHVFVNDPTKGYGLYLDWMYEN